MMRQVARRISDNLTSPPAKWFDCHKTLTVCVRGNTGIEHESRRFRDIELIWRDGRAAPPASTLPKGVQKYLAGSIRHRESGRRCPSFRVADCIGYAARPGIRSVRPMSLQFASNYDSVIPRRPCVAIAR